MSFNDSQLSELIRQGRMIDSQEIEANVTQELSQGTMQRIIDGQFTPIMTQRSEDEFMSHDKLDNKDDSSSTSSIFGPARHTGLKRRTPRIQEINLIDPIIEADEEQANISNDLFGDNNDPYSIGNSSLLNESICSNTTFSQVQWGSQTIPYLRDRTPQEQEERIKEKKRATPESRATDRLEQEERNRMDENMTQRDYDIDNIEDNSMDFEESAEVLKPVETEIELIDPDEYMEIAVIHDKAKRMSDLAYLETDNRKYLWTKMNCKVPITLKWKIDSRRRDSVFWMRVRFVNYKNMDIPRAMNDPTTDVYKCLHHIKEEKLSPPESFFYILDSTLPWKCVVSNLENNKGRHFIVPINRNITEITFNVVFMCQKNCMVVEDKRKPMCLAVVLEDIRGKEVLHGYIEEVMLVGYPGRDYRHFCSKADDFHFPEKSSLKSSVNQPHTSENNRKSIFPPSSDMYKSFESSYNPTISNQMFQSTSNSRKRGASEYVHMNTPSLFDSKPIGYARRLHGCEPKQEQMEYEYDINDNQQSTSAKRSRQSMVSFKTLPLSEEEYSKVVKFLADDAIETRKKWENSVQYPAQAVSRHFELNDPVFKFLNTLGLGHHTHLFNARGISTMADMKREFEKDYEIFEKIEIDPSKLKGCYELFLNFYRIQKGSLLNFANPSTIN